MLFDQFGREIRFSAEVSEKKEEVVEDSKMLAAQQRLAELEATLAKLKGEKEVAKNKRPGKADKSKKYMLLSDKLGKMDLYPKVPKQQRDLAELCINNMKVGVVYDEEYVFNFLIDGCGDYPSLYGSDQDVTYLFRYYRGLGPKNNHAGFIARDFMRYNW